MNKVVLTYISALIGFLFIIVTSVHGYEQDKALKFILQPEVQNKS